MIYLAHAATTPVPRAVADAMYEVLTEQFGNPSSQYPMGLEMKRRVEVWRKTVADALGCGAKQLFFTSCGTEADNWAVTAACWQNSLSLPLPRKTSSPSSAAGWSGRDTR